METKQPDVGSGAMTNGVPERRISTPKSEREEMDAKSQQEKKSLCRKIFEIVTWTPPNCRWDPKKPPEFSMALNVLFAFAAGFTVANLYYNHPILNILAHDFNVPYQKVAQIPTVMQAGYAGGLLFLCPLGDLLPRRPFVCGLVFLTATLWLILCLTHSLTTFTAISFLVAITTVTPQLMLPLVGDLAPPHRRAAALSIVVSGLMLGVLIARVLSGIITNYLPWRSIYWLSLGLQFLIFILLYLFMPAYPSTNPLTVPPGRSPIAYFLQTYANLLLSILKMLPAHPPLIQASLTGLLLAAPFTSFWTTLTFLLSSPPYSYPPLTIGLFGLIGIAGMLASPLFARFVTDKYIPYLSIAFGLCVCIVGVVLGTFLGERYVAGPVLQALLYDAGNQIAQIANRSSIYGIEPKRRNGVNTAYMLSVFCGQLVGTAAGNHIYAMSGWKGAGCASLGFCVAALGVLLVRGPWEEGWVGWRGGWGMRKREKVEERVEGKGEDGVAVGDGEKGKSKEDEIKEIKV